MDISRFIADPRRATDQDVAILRHHALHSVMPVAPVFGSWLHGWCDKEQKARHDHPEDRTPKHMAAVPACEKWTDRELAEALNAIIQVHFASGAPEIIGEWVDRWLQIIAGHAAARLAGEFPRVRESAAS